MTIRFIKAEAHHVRVIARSMRARDVAEVRAGWNAEPEEAMRVALSESYYARVMMKDLEPLCAFGLAPLTVIGGTSRVWIFATEAIDRHPLAFARASRRVLRELFTQCLLATNLIDCKDEPALKWLQWLGGTFVLPVHERGGRLFAQFILVDRTTREQRQCQRG